VLNMYEYNISLFILLPDYGSLRDEALVKSTVCIVVSGPLPVRV